MTYILLALTLSGAMQAPNACDNGTPRVYPLCIGESTVLWFCAAPSTGTLSYTLDLDGVRQAQGGMLVRYGYNAWGQHLEAPNDISLTGKVQYVTSQKVMMPSPGLHTVTITYGSAQTVSIPLMGVTSVTSVTQVGPDGKPLVSECAASAQRFKVAR